MKSFRSNVAAVLCASLISLMFASVASADQPVVSAVPGDANNPTIRHPSIAGRPITLKGAVDLASVGASWSWDPGDGGAAYTGTVAASHWAVWAEHTYAGNAGDFFAATLTVDNGVDPVGTATFEIVLRADTVPNRANAAIGEALWYMHRNQRRFLGDEIAVEGQAESTIPMGSWTYAEYGGSLTMSSQAASLNAFEANGHRENGDATNPYAETVDRGLKYLFARLAADPLVPQTLNSLDANPRSDNPDSNGNGLGISLDNRNLVGISGPIDEPYQLGMVIDGIVASGTPGTVTTTGPADVIGRSYGDIVQDMVDWYAMAQSDSTVHGGWQYSAFNNSNGSQDNSASGWAATGLVAAEDVFGTMIPAWVKTRNQNGLEATDNESDISDSLSTGDGIHGYNSNFPLWGPYGTTGAGMVQMSMNALEATTSPTPDERWVRTENFFRRNFDNGTGSNPLKNYYYGMFNFSKAMRTAKPAPVTIIGTQVGVADDATNGIGCGPNPGCAAGGPSPLDWYNDPVSGLAQTIVSYQTTTGPSIGRFATRNAIGESSQAKHIPAWGTQILTRTLAQAGPIAVGSVSPNPAGENFAITLDHSRSFHQDPNRSLVLFEWDIDNDGTFDVSSNDANPAPPLSVPGGFDCGAGGLPCSLILNLRITDDAMPPVTATDVVILDLTIPPHAPTADAGGPYNVCVNDTITLDGSNSFDIDEGQMEAEAAEADTITAYEWELDGVSPFDYAEAAGVSTDVTFTTVGIASIGLRVTDNSALAYPSASEVNLTDTDNTFVVVADCIAADLSVSATADNANPIIPDNVNVTATITNGGPDDATDVFVVANLSNLVSLTAPLAPDQGTCVATGVQTATQDQYRCDIGDMAAGASVNILAAFFGDTEGTARFEFTVDADGGQLLQLADPNLANNSISAVVILIDEVIIVISGKGSGAFGLLELMLFSALVVALVALRRRKAVQTSAAAIGLALMLVLATVNNTAEADQNDAGFYADAAIGAATSDMDAPKLNGGLTAAGFNVSDVMLDDSETGFKLTFGYMFNKNVGTQISYVDLGELKSEFTASVPPDEIDALLDTAASLLPGRGDGLLADLVLRHPLSERTSLYATLGIFFAGPKSEQTVVVGGTGTSIRVDSDNKFAGSLGVSFAATDALSVKLAWERYDIDGNSTDFPMAALSYRFGADDKPMPAPVAAPDPDSDGDGVRDSRDACPDTPAGHRVDSRGCSLDSDGDGVVDADDKCPNTYRGAKVDAMGCEMDDDKDGVVNRLDECPDTPAGARVDTKGCEIKDVIKLPGVNFETNSDRLVAGSDSVLRDAAATLKKYPDLIVEVAGHTDDSGAADYNQGLSERRAATVRDYLINAGAGETNLSSRGYGEAEPAADNATAAGRAENRRVELRIIED